MGCNLIIFVCIPCLTYIGSYLQLASTTLSIQILIPLRLLLLAKKTLSLHQVQKYNILLKCYLPYSCHLAAHVAMLTFLEPLLVPHKVLTDSDSAVLDF